MRILAHDHTWGVRNEHPTLVAVGFALIQIFERIIRTSPLQKCIHWVLFFAVTFALSGIVLIPTSQVDKSNLSERFPCENCPCGCRSADFCWDQCCCHTDEEKLAWAKREGVRPPDFLVARVSRAALESTASTEHSSCCCCCSSKDAKCVAPNADAVAANAGPPQPVLMWKAAQCRGLDHFWMLLGSVFVSPPWQSSDEPCLLHRCEVRNERVTFVARKPDPPVPWASL